MTRKKLDDMLISVGADKLSHREWEHLTPLKRLKPEPRSVVVALLQRGADTEAAKRLDAKAND